MIPLLTPFLQVAEHAADHAPWWVSSIAGPAGGLVALFILLVLAGRGASRLADRAGRGFYALADRAIDSVHAFTGSIVTEWRRSNDEMRSWLQQHAEEERAWRDMHAAEEIAAMKGIHEDNRRSAQDRARESAVIVKAITDEGRVTRQDVRQAIAESLGADGE